MDNDLYVIAITELVGDIGKNGKMYRAKVVDKTQRTLAETNKIKKDGQFAYPVTLWQKK